MDALLRRLGSGLQLTASCVGDAWIDEHHSVEDVMITVPWGGALGMLGMLGWMGCHPSL